MTQDFVRIEDVLARGETYVGVTSGTSMKPFLRPHCDTVLVNPVRERLDRYDVALYKSGGAYVLHRVVEVSSCGYTMLGDNCLNKECDIADEAVVGVLAAFYRDERYVDARSSACRIYARAWYAIYPLRRMFMLLRARLGGVMRACGGKAAGGDDGSHSSEGHQA